MKYDLVRVTWNDAWTEQGATEPYDSHPVISFGLYKPTNNDNIVLITSYNVKNEVIDYISIPKAIVKSKKILVKGVELNGQI